MASTYSTDLKLELMVTGENAGTWGDKTNSNLNLIQQAIAGYQAVSIAGGAQTTALAMSDASLSNARNMVIEFTGAITGNQIVTIPNGIEKYYILKNSTTGAFTVTFKYASTGSGITLTQGYLTAAYGNGTEIINVDLTTLQGTIATAQITNLAVTSGKLASFAVTSARIASFAVTTAKVNSLAITATRLASFAVTTGKLNTAAVTATRLANTAVTPGTYNAATITVDQQGRITSASSGSAGAGMGIPTLFAVGPASGTYTATPTANRLAVFMVAPGGGGGSGFGMGGPGGRGGSGGFGFYNKPITQPFSQPYSVAAGGNGATSGTGGTGGTTTFTNVGTVNGGTGGNASTGNPGSSGNAPGASFTYPSRSFVIGVTTNIQDYGYGGAGGAAAMGMMCMGNPAYPGSTGSGGALVIFENTGT